ncbi:MAG: hypothetical protein LEGION0398_MBIBDBAK_00035 [Legionellaceae bacterium]
MIRKGAKRISDIPLEILNQLNQGTLETVNLMECLAIDFKLLLSHCFPSLSNELLEKVNVNAKQTWLAKMRLASEILYQNYGEEIIETLLIHPSDTLRGLVAPIIALIPNLSLEECLTRIKPLANDRHFGVREAAWLFIRQIISADIVKAMDLFQDWVNDSSENIRRFAIESTRPRGVWCNHIAVLKESPELGISLLTPLHADSSRYVQNSVANWLNDAAKSKPDWVKNVCMEWQQLNASKATEYICKRALRNCKTL